MWVPCSRALRAGRVAGHVRVGRGNGDVVVHDDAAKRDRSDGHVVESDGEAAARKVLGATVLDCKRCKLLAQKFLWKYRCKRLKLAKLLGQ